MRTINQILIVLIICTCACGNRNSKVPESVQVIENEEDLLDGKEKLDTISKSSDKKPLNEIRFGNWTEKDWHDNDYFRYLRKCFDACYKSNYLIYKSDPEIDNDDLASLQEYKSMLHSQFIVYEAKPFIGGGMFITLIFIEYPDDMFEIAVYSDVDENTETLMDTYHLVGGGLKKMDKTSGWTKKEILEFVQEYPENKLW